MAFFALSDLHLQATEQPFLFTSEKEQIFCQFAGEILNTDHQLVIAGDCIDWTGMQVPQHGQLEFFQELFTSSQMSHPVIQNALKRTEPLSLLKQVVHRFPKFFHSLGQLARHKQLILIPGNHDCEFWDEGLQMALASEISVDPEAIQWKNSARIGKTVLIIHGNQFDPSNETELSCANRGKVITAALYQALLPALVVYGIPERIVHAIPAVRPEEAVIHGIQHYLGEKETKRLVVAFVTLISRNNYFSGWKSPLMFPIRHNIPVISSLLKSYLTPERLYRALPDESLMKNHVREEAERLKERMGDETQVIVFGHTHELDYSSHTMNLGTWIDHITGIGLEHLRAADNSLPILKSEWDGPLTLYDARDLPRAGKLTQCKKIYSLPEDFEFENLVLSQQIYK